MPFLGHVKVCERGEGRPPGEEVYCKDGYSLFEVDGEAHKVGAIVAVTLMPRAWQTGPPLVDGS